MKTLLLSLLAASSVYAAGRFQRAHVRVERFDAGKAVYAATHCTYDAEAKRDTCHDEQLTAEQAAAFEAFLKTLK